MKSGEESIAADVEAKINEFTKTLASSQGKGEFVVSIDFFDKKKDKILFILTEKEKVLEKWVIPFEFSVSEKDVKEIRPDVITRVKKKQINKQFGVANNVYIYLRRRIGLEKKNFDRKLSILREEPKNFATPKVT